MDAVLLFAIVLLVAVLISGLAHRSILSTAVLFLAAGFVAGGPILGIVRVHPTDPLVGTLVELALFTVLFTDGMRVGLPELASAWRLPGRALLLGLPLTLLGTAVLCHLILGMAWTPSLLIGAALSPTDPVFAAALVGRAEVPQRLRFLLNVESGLNDGLALPVVLALLSLADAESIGFGPLIGDLAAGIGIGVAVPFVSIGLERSRFFGAANVYEPLHGVAIGLLVYALTSALHANPFLAAFAAGVTVATRSERVRDAFEGFGAAIAELTKLAAILTFGLLMSLEAARTDPVPLGELAVRGAAPRGRAADRDLAVDDPLRAVGAGVVLGRVVRPEGLRVGRLRAVHPALVESRRTRHVRPDRGRAGAVDGRALHDRFRRRRPVPGARGTGGGGERTIGRAWLTSRCRAHRC